MLPIYLDPDGYINCVCLEKDTVDRDIVCLEEVTVNSNFVCLEKDTLDRDIVCLDNLIIFLLTFLYART